MPSISQEISTPTARAFRGGVAVPKSQTKQATVNLLAVLTSDDQTCYLCWVWYSDKACPYLHQEDDKEVEIGNSSKLFKQVLW